MKKKRKGINIFIYILFFLCIILVSIYIINDKNSGQLLVKSVYNGNLEEFRRILRKHPDYVNYKDEYGVSILHLSLTLKRKEMAKFLIDSGADVNFFVSTDSIIRTLEALNNPYNDNSDSWTNWIEDIYSGSGQGEMVMLFNPDKYKYGESPLFLSMSNNESDISVLLVSKGAMFSGTERGSISPLALACKQNDSKVVNGIINFAKTDEFREINKLYPDYLYSFNDKSLYYAVSNKSATIAERLFQLGFKNTIPITESGYTTNDTDIHLEENSTFLLLEYPNSENRRRNRERVFLVNIDKKSIQFTKIMELNEILNENRKVRYIKKNGEFCYIDLSYNNPKKGRFTMNIINFDNQTKTVLPSDVTYSGSRGEWKKLSIDSYYPYICVFPVNELLFMGRGNYDHKTQEFDYSLANVFHLKNKLIRENIFPQETINELIMPQNNYMFKNPTVSPNEQYLSFYISSNQMFYKPSLVIYDLGSREIIYNHKLEGMVDNQIPPLIKWSSDSKSVLLFFEDNKRNWITSLDIFTGESKKLIEIEESSKLLHIDINKDVMILTFLNGIYIIKKDVVTKANIDDVDEYSGAKLDPSGKRLLFVGKNKDEVSLYVYNIKSRKYILRKMRKGSIMDFQTGWFNKSKKSLIY